MQCEWDWDGKGVAAHRVDWVLEIGHASLALDVLQLVLVHASDSIASGPTPPNVLCSVERAVVLVYEEPFVLGNRVELHLMQGGGRWRLGCTAREGCRGAGLMGDCCALELDDGLFSEGPRHLHLKIPHMQQPTLECWFRGARWDKRSEEVL